MIGNARFMPRSSQLTRMPSIWKKIPLLTDLWPLTAFSLPTWEHLKVCDTDSGKLNR